MVRTPLEELASFHLLRATTVIFRCLRRELTVVLLLLLHAVESLFLVLLGVFFLTTKIMPGSQVPLSHLLQCQLLAIDFLILNRLHLLQVRSVGNQAPVDLLHSLHEDVELNVLRLHELLGHVQAIKVKR